MESPNSNSIDIDAAQIRTVELLEQIRRWNQTATEYPRDKTVAQLFEEVAAAHPGAVALEIGDARFSYGELNARANRVARSLRDRGVTAEKLVGCLFERSVEMIVAFLAVLKAGGAFVPLDPTDPAERTEFLLAHAGLHLVLAQKGVAPQVSMNCEVVSMADPEACGAADDATDLESVSGPKNLAYVMYTSGSTGKPKGVMVENRAIVRLVRNTDYCHFGRDEVFLQFAPASFDASTFEIWGPLLNGGKLVLAPAGITSLVDLGREIREHGVTTLWLTSGLFNLMVEQRLEDLRDVRQLLVGGDVLSPRHVRIALENLPDCRLINGYGPTENTTFTCCYEIERGRRVGESIPIGRPIANTQVYILDETMNPVAAGQIGELYAAGDGVARGYFNDPAATVEKFLPNPFSTDATDRMYRTGDLARWREDGVIEFVGRIDDQVKISGHRVEPAESETVLRMNKDVSQVCVMADANEDGTKRLIAYYVSSFGDGPSASDLRRYLSGKLPQYMIPAAFVQLAALPLSPNGKVDRSALPKPPVSLERANGENADATGTEKTVSELWKRVLRLETVGLDENFFDVGGDSLAIIALHSNLQKTLEIEIPVTDLFEFTTIRTLARHLEAKNTPESRLPDMQPQAAKQREAFERQKRVRAGGRA
jgi:amino acid adenylation domain-containing protein